MKRSSSRTQTGIGCWRRRCVEGPVSRTYANQPAYKEIKPNFSSQEETFAPFRSLRTSLGELQHVVKAHCDALLVYQQATDTGGRQFRDYQEAIFVAHKAFVGNSVLTADSRGHHEPGSSSIAERLVSLLYQLSDIAQLVSEGAREWDIDKISCYVGTLVIYRDHWDGLETKEQKRYLNLWNACVWVLVDHQSETLNKAFALRC